MHDITSGVIVAVWAQQLHPIMRASEATANSYRSESGSNSSRTQDAYCVLDGLLGGDGTDKTWAGNLSQ